MKTEIRKKPRKAYFTREHDLLIWRAFNESKTIYQFNAKVRKYLEHKFLIHEIKERAHEMGINFAPLYHQRYYESRYTTQKIKMDHGFIIHTSSGDSGKVNMFSLASEMGLVKEERGMKHFRGNLLNSMADWVPVMKEVNKIRLRSGQDQIGYVKEWLI